MIVFGSILNSSDVFASVTLQQMDVCVSFNPMDATASAGSRENGGRLRVCHGVNNIGHVCWSDVKLTTKFKFKFVTDAETSGRVHVMGQTVNGNSNRFPAIEKSAYFQLTGNRIPVNRKCKPSYRTQYCWFSRGSINSRTVCKDNSKLLRSVSKSSADILVVNFMQIW